MDKLREKIWQRGPAGEIMREAYKGFRDRFDKNPVATLIALASVHYSLVKRYMSWWKLPFALWHLRQAMANVENALSLDPAKFQKLTPDQADVVATIYAKVPRWLGGAPLVATSLLNSALYLRGEENMKPHTRALMLITLGNIEYRMGNTDRAWKHYTEARQLIGTIETEDSPDREQQLARVLTAVGFFYHDHAGGELYLEGLELLKQALKLAGRVSKDQEEKIFAGLRKRGAVIE